MKTIIKKLSVFVAAFALAATALLVPIAAPVYAQNAVQDGINSAKGTGVPEANLTEGDDSIFKTVVNIMLFVIGALSVIMLIWGGIRYATSAGNSAAVTSAKNTIMYALIGLIVAFLAFAVVNWVLSAITPA